MYKMFGFFQRKGHPALMNDRINDMRRKRLLIFDCDGVLFDSHGANIAFFNRCLAKGGYPPLEEALEEKVAYMSTRQLIYDLMADTREAERLFRVSQETDYSPFIPGLRPLFDFEDVLGRLSSRHRLAVATNRGRSIERLTAHFGLDRWFDYFASTLDAEPKPDPEMLMKCMARCNVTAGETVYFGDADSDREAAERAGIDFVRVGDGLHGITSVADLLLNIPEADQN